MEMGTGKHSIKKTPSKVAPDGESPSLHHLLVQAEQQGPLNKAFHKDFYKSSSKSSINM